MSRDIDRFEERFKKRPWRDECGKFRENFVVWVAKKLPPNDMSLMAYGKCFILNCENFKGGHTPEKLEVFWEMYVADQEAAKQKQAAVEAAKAAEDLPQPALREGDDPEAAQAERDRVREMLKQKGLYREVK